MAHKKVKVVVLGGGFAGVKTVRELAEHPNIDITLITDQETFRYGATIWRTATGHLKEASYMPVANLIPKQDSISIIYDQATTIDRHAKTVTTKGGETFSYDYCVIGLGVVTSYFGIKGLDKYSYGVKTSQEFNTFREHLHKELVSDNALDKNYVIVGAGPTGVELAAALHGYLGKIAKQHNLPRNNVRMQLIEAAPRILPTLNPTISKAARKQLHKIGVVVHTKSVVKGETATSLLIGNTSVPTQTVVWTAGVTNNPFFEANKSQFALNDRKRVIVDGYLQVDPCTYVIGDSAATPFSGLALTAIHNAKYVSRSIVRKVQGKNVRPYKPSVPVTIVPVGENWAAFQWRNLVIMGKFASWLRVLLDFVGFAEVMPMRQAARIWLKRNKMQEDCSFCQASE